LEEMMAFIMGEEEEEVGDMWGRVGLGE